MEEGSTSRNVYFPFSNWYNLHDGKFYKNGTSKIENVQLTDKLPLFLREGTVILMQNTDQVQSTKDLGNNFNLVAGFRRDNGKSNSTHQVYEAAGIHISIGDYNDETKLQLCLAEGCEYTFNLVLTVTENSRSLELKTGFAGGIRLNDVMTID